MRLIEYSKLRAGVQLNARPASIPEIRSTALQLQQALLTTGLFAQVEVDWTEDADHMVVAMCVFHPALTDEQAARRLEDVWLNRLRFGYWAAHSTLVSNDQVELQGATLRTMGGPYLTLHVVAQRDVSVRREAPEGRTTVPPQRVAAR
jgi:hypothetical protein